MAGISLGGGAIIVGNVGISFFFFWLAVHISVVRPLTPKAGWTNF